MQIYFTWISWGVVQPQVLQSVMELPFIILNSRKIPSCFSVTFHRATILHGYVIVHAHINGVFRSIVRTTY